MRRMRKEIVQTKKANSCRSSFSTIVTRAFDQIHLHSYNTILTFANFRESILEFYFK